MQISHLPRDVIIHILCMLQIQTLFSLKCVNKFFREFISSRDFVRFHLKYTTENATLSSCRIILSQSSRTKQFHLKSLSLFELVRFVEIRGPPGTLIGSCNGLLCSVTERKNCVLWNPCIVEGGEVKCSKLRRPFANTKRCVDIRYGLGYDKSDDDYKVVASCVFRRKKDEYYSVPMVFSLRRNSWRKVIQNFAVVLDSYAYFANGKIYWLTDTSNNYECLNPEKEFVSFEVNSKRELVSFDVEREVFEIVEQPNYKHNGPLSLSLGVIAGSICVICNFQINYIGYFGEHQVDTRANLWVMNEHGTKKSWTNLYQYGDSICFLTPCPMLPLGIIMLLCMGTLEVRETQTGYGDVFAVEDLEGLFGYYTRPFIYINNLVSPFGSQWSISNKRS